MTQNFFEGVTSDGLTVANYDDLLNFVQSSMNQIYATDGEGINFDSETPDGQMTNILAQAGADVRELAQGVYNSFDPDKCSGSIQDVRYSLNYLFRNGGTFTIQNIDVTVDRTVELQGLDANYNSLSAASYTVSDDSGNLWYLIDSTELTAGTHSLPFRSQNYGTFQPTIGTITIQVTKVLGVTSINNSVAPTTLGALQEADMQFRLRRQRSTAIRGQNNTDAMLGQILDLEGVTDATIWVNNNNEIDSTGTSPFTVWVIVEGGANTDIADIIYSNSNGLPTRGEISTPVTAVSGQIFNTHFDRANPIPLYIKFDFKLTVEQDATDSTGIASYIAQNLVYALNEAAETSKITEIATQAIASNGGGGYALNVQISTDGKSYTDYIPSGSIQNKFVVDATRISVNVIEME